MPRLALESRHIRFLACPTSTFVCPTISETILCTDTRVSRTVFTSSITTASNLGHDLSHRDISNPAIMSTEEAEETQSTFGDGGGGPGAPTPLAVLEARSSNASNARNVSLDTDTLYQGVAGLSARDIKLIVDGGFNTVESVAYTWVNPREDTA